MDAPQFTNTRGLAGWGVAGLSLLAIAQGLNVGLSAVQRGWYAGETQPVDESFDTIRGLSVGIALLTLATLAVTGVLWVLWLYFSYRNIPALGGHRQHKQRWSWLGWIIPIVNLYRPKQIHNEVWHSGSDSFRTPPWLGLWWAGWLIAVFASSLVSDDAYTWADVFSSAAIAATATLAIPVLLLSTRRQLARRRHLLEQAEPERDRRALAFVAPGAVLLASGLAAMAVIAAPHSVDATGGEPAMQLRELTPGDCFDTIGIADEVDLVWVRECSAPHEQEIVGEVVLPQSRYPGADRLHKFSTLSCLGQWYEYAGENGDHPDYDVILYKPSLAGWSDGDRKVQCVAVRVDREALSTSVRDGASEWVLLDHVTIGDCYEFHPSFLAAKPADCDAGGSYVSGLVIHDGDPFQDYPGRTALLEQLGQCADDPVAQYLTPEPEGWELGDRISICFRSSTPTA